MFPHYWAGSPASFRNEVAQTLPDDHRVECIARNPFSTARPVK
jgi:hypothetical protein